MCAGELGVWCPKRQRQCESSVRNCSDAGCHWLSFWEAEGHLLCPCPVWGEQWFAFQEEINWLHLAEIELCVIDVSLGFYPQSYWIKILLENVQVLFPTLTQVNFSWAWVHHSPTFASYKHSQNEQVVLQEPSLLLCSGLFWPCRSLSHTTGAEVLLLWPGTAPPL